MDIQSSEHGVSLQPGFEHKQVLVTFTRRSDFKLVCNNNMRA